MHERDERERENNSQEISVFLEEEAVHPLQQRTGEKADHRRIGMVTRGWA